MAPGEPDFIKALTEAVNVFSRERDWAPFHSPKNLSMALAVEVAELMEHFQWLREQQSATLSPEKKDAVAQELADVLIYLVRLASQLDIDLESAAWSKLDLNRQKYPIEKARGTAKKYDEL